MNAADWYKQNKERLGNKLSKKELKDAADQGVKKSDLSAFVEKKGKIKIENKAQNFLDNKYKQYKI